MERRFLSTASRPVELRAEEGKPAKIAGYAAVFYNPSDPGTEYELMRHANYSVSERLMPGCFDRALREDDVRALFNHDTNQILGRTRAGTCQLSIDGIGLRYEIDPPDTQAGRDLLVSLGRQDVTGSSFCFDYRQKSITMQTDGDSERDIIEVRDVKLYDVGPVCFPAYTSTTAGVRSTDAEALKRELDALRAERKRDARGKLARARLLDL